MKLLAIMAELAKTHDHGCRYRQGPFNLSFHPQLGLLPLRLFRILSALGLIQDSVGFPLCRVLLP